MARRPGHRHERPACTRRHVRVHVQRRRHAPAGRGRPHGLDCRLQRRLRSRRLARHVLVHARRRPPRTARPPGWVRGGLAGYACASLSHGGAQLGASDARNCNSPLHPARASELTQPSPGGTAVPSHLYGGALPYGAHGTPALSPGTGPPSLGGGNGMPLHPPGACNPQHGGGLAGLIGGAGAAAMGSHLQSAGGASLPMMQTQGGAAGGMRVGSGAGMPAGQIGGGWNMQPGAMGAPTSHPAPLFHGADGATPGDGGGEGEADDKRGFLQPGQTNGMMRPAAPVSAGAGTLACP
ncbi:hypothetical protein T492DRAFT_966761 [Pavlovales sp. CCMP2436]|nr:hypothetical protein T492DRAFT_966761 [Pavlovales sp. CCMP2436]